MYINNFPNSNAINDFIPCSFNAANGQGVVFYSGENSSYLQYIDVPQSVTITQMSISIYDRWGFSINSSGSD